MVGIINGKQIAEKALDKLAQKIKKLRKETGQSPGLTSIMVGGNSASLAFIKIKQKTAQRIGINCKAKYWPANFSAPKIINYIREQNASPNTHGIMVQLPLPAHLRTMQVLKSIHPFKDVDCLHPKNLGLLAHGKSVFLPPAVKVVKKILQELKIGTQKLQRMRVVLVGGGVLVGRPLALWLMQNKATLTICQEYTQNLSSYTQKADLLITAAGTPGLIQDGLVKQEAIVIDFGTTRQNGKIAGDVNFQQIAKKALVTPTPFGTGPLTVESLLENVVESFTRSHSRAD